MSCVISEWFGISRLIALITEDKKGNVKFYDNQ